MVLKTVRKIVNLFSLNRMYIEDFVTPYSGPPLNFLSTGSHANCPGISLSVSSYKGILYLKNLGGDHLKKPPCIYIYVKVSLTQSQLWGQSLLCHLIFKERQLFVNAFYITRQH